MIRQEPKLDVRVFQASKDDGPKISMLMQDMALFYGEEAHTADLMLTFIQDLPAGVEFLLATDRENDEVPVGFAAFATLAPGPDLGAQLFMKDLYVAAKFRGRGVGRLILRALARVALTRGYSRIDWAVESRNALARQLYDGIGGRPIDRLYYRLDNGALDALARGQ